jgi:4-amino-4-deoxy-L-arabinose transferase-like glycosyltransferase
MGGIPLIPFHPDESTQIFMSRDFDLLLSDPKALFWREAQSSDPLQIYRELDSPLTRMMIGLGRYFTGQTATTTDWNWSLSWTQNEQSGALPSQELLIVSRISVAFFFPASLILIYLIGKTMAGKFTGYLAAILFASNALILLHTRRAMAESILIFTICASIYSLFGANKKPWLAAICIALAVNSKQLSIPLVVVGLIVIILQSKYCKETMKQTISKSGIFLTIVLAISYILNPFLWSNPFAAGVDAIATRQNLIRRQSADLAAQAPGILLDTPLKRVTFLIAHVFIASPAIADVGNYSNEQEQSKEAYISVPINRLFRGFAWGGLSIIFCLIGLWALIRQRKKTGIYLKEEIILITFTTQVVFLLATISLPFQRYWICLIPFIEIFIAVGINDIYLFFHKLFWIKKQFPG